MKPEQLNIFDRLVMESAGELLDMLNEGVPKKELYAPQYRFKEGQYHVFMVSNKQKKAVFNVLDDYGRIPDGFCANWRDWVHIKQELHITTKHF